MTLHVAIDGKDREAMTDLVRRHRVDVVRTTVRKGEGRYRVDALVGADRVKELEELGYGVRILADAEEVAAQRRDDIEWHPDDLPGHQG